MGLGHTLCQHTSLWTMVVHSRKQQQQQQHYYYYCNKSKKWSTQVLFLASFAALFLYQEQGSIVQLDDVTVTSSVRKVTSTQERNQNDQYKGMWSNRTVPLMKRHSYLYSGMYWCNTTAFLKLPTAEIQTLEHASWKLFQLVPHQDTKTTVDWFDFGVEHLSGYTKQLLNDDTHPDTFPQVLDVIRRYFHTNSNRTLAQFPDIDKTVAPKTLAILPFFPTDPAGLRAEDLLQMPTTTTTALLSYDMKQSYALVYNMLATIISLWKIGIGRIVIAGRTQERPVMIRALHLLMERMTSNVSTTNYQEISYACGLDNATQEKTKDNEVIVLPRYVIKRVQEAFRGELSSKETEQFLGIRNVEPDTLPFEYIYFTEPDLILHTRPSALNVLSRQLEDGKVIAAHRFQLLPHAVDFPKYHDIGLVLPNVKPFNKFIDLDPLLRGDACCDRGKYSPALNDYPKTCGWKWHTCGFEKAGDDIDNVNETIAKYVRWHQRLSKYPMIRLETGIKVPFVHARGRLCRPIKSGVCRQRGS